MSASSTSNPLPALAGNALAMLAQLEGTERAIVLTQEGEGLPVVRRLSGTVEADELGSKEAVPGFSLWRVIDHKKSLLALDVTQDTAFATCPGRQQVRSVLCVAIPGAAGPVGYLYADHTFKVGAFTHADLKSIEDFAARLGPELEAALAQARRAPVPPPPQTHREVLTAAAIVVAAGLVWLGGGILLQSQAVPPPAPPPLSMQTATPGAVSAGYLSLLKLKQFARAWNVLSPAQQKRISPERYQHAAEGWVRQGSNLWELDYRHIGPAAVTGRRAEVWVEGPEGARRWRFQLGQDEKGAWRLEQWDGGPLAEEPTTPLNTP